MLIKEIQNKKTPLKYLLISGLADIEIDYEKNEKHFKSICEENRVLIQFFNAELIADWEHLYFSVLNALKAFEQEKNLSNKLNFEILLYASGQRQIKIAIKELGISSEIRNIALLILGESEDSVKNAWKKILEFVDGRENNSVLEIDKKKYEIICSYFKISPLEMDATSNSDKWEDKLEALIKIVINRIAFVVFEK
ncbi:MAG: KEOPS complex subunit Cgi121 [Candidatus Helarchaeota archaeon]